MSNTEKKHRKHKAPEDSMKHVMSNIAYAFKQVYKISPKYVYMNFARTTVYSLTDFFTSAFLLRLVVNEIQLGGTFTKVLLFMACIFFASYLANCTFYWYDNVVEPVLQIKITANFKKLMFEKSKNVELSCYENKEFFDKYVKAASEIQNRYTNVMWCILNLYRRILCIALQTALIASIDPWLFLFAVIPCVTSVIFGKKLNKIEYKMNMEKKEQERQRDYTRRTFYLQEFAKEMRITQIHKLMFVRFKNAVQNILGIYKKYGFKIAFINLVIYMFTSCITTWGTMLYTAYRTLVSKTMLFGDMIVVTDSVGYLSALMANLIKESFLKFHEHSQYIDNIRSFLDYEPQIKGGLLPTPKDNTCLELKNVYFRYDGQDKDILKNICITVNKNEKIALVGHNGAGKTTLAKLILRLYDPTKGEILYGGNNIKDYKLDCKDGYRERFGVVFQDFKLFAMSVTDNVLLREKKPNDDMIIENALKNSGAFEKVSSFKNKENTILTKEFDNDGEVLSGGEGQKISIARIFAKDSSIVILDEPSSALDPIAEYNMYENMMKACANKSVIFISHRLSSAVLADKIYLIENGEIAETGSHEELMSKNGKYCKMFTIQAENYALDKREEANI